MTKTATSTTKPTLSIIGAGKLGKTLARLWSEQGFFTLTQIMTRQRQSAEAAVNFVGAGQARWQIETLQKSDVYLIATPDQDILASTQSLADAGLLSADSIVFHCSGALSSQALVPAEASGTSTASVHPVHSFAQPKHSLQQFSGSTCTYEGSSRALKLLLPAFTALGANMLSVNRNNKALYHAGSVFACNYLVSLIEVSLNCFEAAGINKSDAAKLLEPLMSGTLSNVLNGQSDKVLKSQYLTGPIARGEHDIVAKQLASLEQQLPQHSTLYKELGKVAVKVAQNQNSASSEQLEAITRLFNTTAPGP